MSNLSSSSSNNGNEFYEFGERFPIIHCKCGHQLKIRTSWTNENPGRRFWLCSAGISRLGCGFVDWYDPPMCSRSKRIIPGLLKRINRQDEEIRVLNMKLQGQDEEIRVLNMKLQGEKQQEKGKVFNKIVGILVVIFVGFVASICFA
ncbi:uncharacterized protein LOC116001418 [Ipomoea triloba]|uniref:uncharacterized protein LOC116001418 n=1 Tax=Ipomoea triloba TaxID=35885 RepID=UPI00125DEB72|nr:uncharacterized protein LOC116001418 [Ipomoea triloba]